MSLPEPVPGLVIRYSYLWYEEHQRQQEEGAKDRPCLVVLAIRREGGDTIVTVAPITHQQPAKGDRPVEISAKTKRRLGLDDKRSWIVTNELNEFVWPGPDIRSVAPNRFDYGLIPRASFVAVKAAVLAHLQEHGLSISRRT